MRKKIEELRNREEGFTLVELLAVLVILAIIVAIAIPMVGSVTENADSQANKAEAELVENAARLYYLSESEEDAKSVKELKVQDLIDEGYLDVEKAEDVVPGSFDEDERGNVTYEPNEPVETPATGG